MQYVADSRERYLDDFNQTVAKLVKRLPNQMVQKCARELKHFEEIQEQRKQLKDNVIGRQQMHLKSVIFERDNLQMELDEAFNQIEKLEEQIEVAVKAGGDEVLHTVMEIRQNPYEDLDDGGIDNFKDRTVDMCDAPLEDLTANVSLKPRGRPGPVIPPLGQSASANDLNVE